jgi:hypothetical protein
MTSAVTAMIRRRGSRIALSTHTLCAMGSNSSAKSDIAGAPDARLDVRLITRPVILVVSLSKGLSKTPGAIGGCE